MLLYHINEQKFDVEIWKENAKKRYLFVGYIMKSKMPLRKTKEEIRELFGQEGNYFPFDRWTYLIGKGILGNRYLVFYFCEDRVKKMKIEFNK